MPDSERDGYLRTIAELTETVTSLAASLSLFRQEQAKREELHAIQLEALNSKLDAALRALHGKKSERSKRPPKMKSPSVLLGPTRTPEQSAELRQNNRTLIEC